jgi:hypothetical protein
MKVRGVSEEAIVAVKCAAEDLYGDVRRGENWAKEARKLEAKGGT